MRSFIIHLRGDTRRAPNAEKLLSLLPGAEIVEAVAGGAALAAGAAPVRPGDLFLPRYPFALGPGEVGCFLSHRACWRKIAEGGDDFALIAEDDMAPVPALWADALALIAARAGPDLYVRLPAKPRERPAAVIAGQGRARLILPRVIGLQTVAQVVGRDAARRLLAASETLDRPVDALVQMHWITGQRVHAILPCAARELTAELGGSTIGKTARGGGRPGRELARAWYRAQIARHPQSP